MVLGGACAVSEWHLIIDAALCHNCGNCVLAAKDEYVGNDFPGYSLAHPPQGQGVMHIDRKIRGTGSRVDAAYLPRMCNHCADAPCMKAAPEAVRRRPDGIVIIDPVAARGRRDIVDACPYGAIIWNEEKEIPQNWIFDAHLLDQGWSEPRCEQACPTKAITSSQVSPREMARRAAEEGLQVLSPELQTRPRVYYRNLHRFDACFIAGGVQATVDGKLECIVNANVTLLHEGRELGQTRSDVFGDFKFDHLEPNSGSYRLEFAHDEFLCAVFETSLGAESVDVGEIELRPS